MKIWHRGHLGTEHKAFLESAGVDHKPWFSAIDEKKVNSYMFIVSEDHPAWPEVAKRLGGAHKYYISTEFTKNEIAEAEWSMAHARHSIGSFVPEKQWWSDLYYGDRCKNCGAGWRQIAPFRIKKEPKLGKKVFADFGSAFELFCAPVVLEAFRKQGIGGFETQPLILDQEDRPAESLEQLIVMEIAGPAIAEDLVERQRYSQTDCPVCGNTWHAHYTRGALPLWKAALNPKVDFQLTNEWFGNGRTARREILFSRRVVNLALENKWQGIEFIPVAVV
jgi:hypothetical protein